MPTLLCSFPTYALFNEAILVLRLLGWCSNFPQPQELLSAVLCWQTNALLTHVLIQEQVYLFRHPVTML